MTTPTSNAVPSNDVNDLLFNAEKLDEAINGTGDTYVDRLGAQHLTMVGAMKKLGYQVPVAFASGLTITSASQTVIYSSQTYHANPASVPFTTTSTFSSAQWLLVSNATLQDLASTASGKGASLLGIQDSAGKFSSSTVEGALAEVATTAEVTAASIRSGVATGTADAIIAAFANPITALTHGQTVLVRAAYANATTTPTLQANALTAWPIVKGANQALAIGDISGAGHWLELQADTTLSKFVLQNPATGVSVVTAANDSGFADSSTKPASTGWIRGAMSAIATAAGFAASFATNGYIKFPSWLGSLIINWGVAQVTSSTSVVVTYALAYTSTPYATLATNRSGASSSIVVSTDAGSATQMTILTSSSTTMNMAWLAIGK